MAKERLDLDQDLRFQRREWRLQRVGWFLWIALIAAGLAGAVGPGPISSQRLSTSDGRLAVEYERFVHRHYPTELRLSIEPEDEQDKSLRVRISQTLLDRIKIARIHPEPVLSELTADGVWFEFGRQPGAERVTVVWHIEHDKIGRGAGQLQLAGSQPLSIPFFVYP
ncbi:MAG TPA: hypothetical protein VF175_12665 [Lacipirellula sp.]